MSITSRLYLLQKQSAFSAAMEQTFISYADMCMTALYLCNAANIVITHVFRDSTVSPAKKEAV